MTPDIQQLCNAVRSIVVSNRMRKIFIILSVWVLVSCSESLDIQLASEANVYFSTDKEREIRLTPQDKEYQNLKQWLSENRSGWYPTSGPYPGGVYIKSGVHGIQITGTQVVLYSTTSSKPRSMYIKTIDKDELKEIKNLAK